MLMHFDSERPVFLQVAEKMEDAILTGAFEEEQQVPSTTELSVSCKINPATALKGINLLVEDGILYKKRGVGMFVCTGAAEKIRSKRRMAFLHQQLEELSEEAQKLGITKREVIRLIETGFPQWKDEP